MKTLNSRAETCAVNLYLNPETYNEDKADGYKEGYIDGATDQHKIDIDKACEWLRNNMPLDYDVEHGIDYEVIDLEEFRKAMEE